MTDSTLSFASDEKSFLRTLEQHSVRYLVTGSCAEVFYGADRVPNDLDIIVGNSQRNARRTVAALSAFGVSGPGLTVKKFVRPHVHADLRPHYYHIDVLTVAKDVTFEPIYARRRTALVGDLSVPIIWLADLIASKRTRGQPRDLEDIVELTKLLDAASPTF